MVYKDRQNSDLEKKAKKALGKLVEPEAIDRTILQTIAYLYPHRKVTVRLTSDEFTCVCPFSGLPDFAQLTITYVPRTKLIEMKSLKYYLFAYRNVKIYNEHVVNKILEDLVKVLKPHEITVIGEFSARGGVFNTVTATHRTKK